MKSYAGPQILTKSKKKLVSSKSGGGGKTQAENDHIIYHTAWDIIGSERRHS